MSLARTRRVYRRSAWIRRPTTTPAERIAPLLNWPLDECLVTSGYAERVTVLWIRKHPQEARYVSALVRANLSGGIEQAWTLVDAGPAATWSMIEDVRGGETLVRTDPEVALRLLDQAEQGGASAADWQWTSLLFRGDSAPLATVAAATVGEA